MSETWQERHANMLDGEADEIRRALGELGNVERILETHHRTDVCAELRALASALRAEVSAMTSAARALRITETADVMPISLTTRTVKR